MRSRLAPLATPRRAFPSAHPPTHPTHSPAHRPTHYPAALPAHSLPSGLLYDKFGGRLCGCAGAIVAGVGLFGMAGATSFPQHLSWLMYPSYSLCNLGGTVNTYSVYVFLWLVRRRRLLQSNFRKFYRTRRGVRRGDGSELRVTLAIVVAPSARCHHPATSIPGQLALASTLRPTTACHRRLTATATATATATCRPPQHSCRITSRSCWAWLEV